MTRELIFLMDESTLGTAIRQLKRKGIKLITCGEVGLLHTPDVEILQYATENGYIMVTCDNDFLKIDAEWQANNQKHCGIVYFRMEDQCKEVSIVVKELSEIHELIQEGAGTIEADLDNRIWRVKT